MAAPSLVVEAIVAILVVASGLLSLLGALGLLRLPTFFQRMHPPALASTLATWCAALATLVYFSSIGSRLAPYPWVIVVLVAITAPITTVLLARAALFRGRAAGGALPPPVVTDTRRREPGGPPATE
jgi:multicomponent K+:H+ antiporter subunit G